MKMRKLFCTATVFVALCGCSNPQRRADIRAANNSAPLPGDPPPSQEALAIGGKAEPPSPYDAFSCGKINGSVYLMRELHFKQSSIAAMKGVYYDGHCEEVERKLGVPPTFGTEGSAHTSGPNSPAVTGDGNSIITYVGGNK